MEEAAEYANIFVKNMETPANYKETMSGYDANNWKKELDSELKWIKELGEYNLVNKQLKRKHIPTKGVFK